jgi:hypothetical protein
VLVRDRRWGGQERRADLARSARLAQALMVDHGGLDMRLGSLPLGPEASPGQPLLALLEPRTIAKKTLVALSGDRAN